MGHLNHTREHCIERLRDYQKCCGNISLLAKKWKIKQAGVSTFLCHGHLKFRHSIEVSALFGQGLTPEQVYESSPRVRAQRAKTFVEEVKDKEGPLLREQDSLAAVNTIINMATQLRKIILVNQQQPEDK